jgi:hypothetical protein
MAGSNAQADIASSARANAARLLIDLHREQAELQNEILARPHGNLQVGLDSIQKVIGAAEQVLRELETT